MSLVVFTLLTLIFAGSISLAQRTCGGGYKVNIVNAPAGTNGQYAQAVSLCQHKIDQCRAVGWGRLTYSELQAAQIIDATPTTGPYSFSTIDGVSNYLSSATTQLSVTTQNQTIGATTVSYSKVTVTISWKSLTYNTTPSSVTVTGLIANVT